VILLHGRFRVGEEKNQPKKIARKLKI